MAEGWYVSKANFEFFFIRSCVVRLLLLDLLANIRGVFQNLLAIFTFFS